MDITPEQVAEYANKDSLALKEVALADLLEELRIRGTEACKLHRTHVIKRLQSLTDDLEKAYDNSIKD
jgi:hypothetical protein